MLRKSLSAAPFVAAALCSPLPLSAEEQAWSYTAEEMYERAQAFRALRERKDKRDTTSEMLLERAMYAAEFKGYIAAVLDSALLDKRDEHKEVRECASILRVNDMTYHAAVLITGGPLDRSVNAALGAYVAMRMVCREAIKRKRQ